MNGTMFLCFPYSIAGKVTSAGCCCPRKAAKQLVWSYSWPCYCCCNSNSVLMLSAASILQQTTTLLQGVPFGLFAGSGELVCLFRFCPQQDPLTCPCLDFRLSLLNFRGDVFCR